VFSCSASGFLRVADAVWTLLRTADGSPDVITFVPRQECATLRRYSRGGGRLPCLVCGALSDGSRCRVHRTRQARGYDTAHYEARDLYIRSHPVCQRCMHTALHYGKCPVPGCPKCPLELDHTPSLDWIRKHPGEPYTLKYTVLCRQCNREKSNHVT
jgi:hypothetical protein